MKLRGVQEGRQPLFSFLPPSPQGKGDKGGWGRIKKEIAKLIA